MSLYTHRVGAEEGFDGGRVVERKLERPQARAVVKPRVLHAVVHHRDPVLHAQPRHPARTIRTFAPPLARLPAPRLPLGALPADAGAAAEVCAGFPLWLFGGWAPARSLRRRVSSEAPAPSAVRASSKGVSEGGRRSDRYLLEAARESEANY